MVNRAVVTNFPSTVHTNLHGVIYTAIPRAYLLGALLWYCDAKFSFPFSFKNRAKWVGTEFYVKLTGVFGFSIYRAHKSVLTVAM